ncbi:MAG TPA: hypothetical protein VJW20_19990 [Candidatus Angelobacter sp.]|nr:hypothetical protein [Candidatus Angelobacter sp.]
MDSTLRPMSTSQVLDRTFHLYRNNFWLFAGIAALPPAVILVAQTGFVLLAFLFSIPKLNPFATGIAFAAGVLLMIVLYLLVLSLATGATVYAVSRVHLGHAVKISESYRAIRPLVWRIVRIVITVAIRFAGAMAIAIAIGFAPSFLLSLGPLHLNSGSSAMVGWLVGLLTVAGVIVCVIWALRLYCSYQLAIPACVLERLGAAACLKRSRFLSKGKCVHRILLVLFLAGVLGYVLTLAFSIPVFIVAMLAMEKYAALAIPMAIWQYFAGFLAGTLAGPIATIALALLYYDERVRKEAFDLQLMMEAMGEQAPQQMAAAAPAPTIG